MLSVEYQEAARHFILRSNASVGRVRGRPRERGVIMSNPLQAHFSISPTSQGNSLTILVLAQVLADIKSQ